ncbi:unnamed protein product [Rhizophagus irregularis]|nr:unnamed protein product [Rhizophagus irregularis]
MGSSSHKKWCYAGSGFQSSLLHRYEEKQSIFVSRIEEKRCIVEIYRNSTLIKQFIGKTSDEAWENQDSWKNLLKYFFTNWAESENPIIDFELSLRAIYPKGYEFSERELGA